MSLRTLQRGKDKPYLTEGQKHAIRRVADLTRIYRDQYPNGLPHNDVGVAYAKYICRTMAFLPDDRRRQWLDRYTPWMDAEIRESILSLGPHWYSARSLGSHLEIDNEDRERLQVWTVEAFDISKEQREVINRDKNRESHERRRRKAGAKPQAQSERRTKPWVEMDISQRTYYRRKKAGTISSRPILVNRRKDEVVPSGGSTSHTAILPPAPSQPNGQQGHGGNVPATSQQEPVTPSQPQADRSSRVTDIADYLARKKAVAARRHVDDAEPLRIAA